MRSRTQASAALVARDLSCPPPTAKWADVMGWLRAVPPGANADEAGPIPQDGEDSKIAPHTYIMSTMDYRRPDARREKRCTRESDPEAGVFIDCGFAPPPAAPNLESLPISPELQSLVDAIAEAYCARCRDSATMGEGEGDWRAHASDTVMGGLRRYKDFAKILRVNGSDKPWRTELKPVRATTVIQRTIMPPPFAISPMAVEPKSPPAPPNQPNSFSSSTGVILNPPFDRQPAQFEPLDTDTLSYTSGYTSHSDPDSLSTPKPDISVGLEHRSFSPSQQSTLNYLETDPHAQTIGLHFPFLIFEAKGNAGLFGAQNQAAVGAACMLRILDLVHCRDLVVWSVTTKDPYMSCGSTIGIRRKITRAFTWGCGG
ncbi:hypothetical protein PSPO01_16364 [Paraphaeosphaeria sporulosa]